MTPGARAEALGGLDANDRARAERRGVAKEGDVGGDVFGDRECEHEIRRLGIAALVYLGLPGRRRLRAVGARLPRNRPTRPLLDRERGDAALRI